MIEIYAYLLAQYNLRQKSMVDIKKSVHRNATITGPLILSK